VVTFPTNDGCPNGLVVIAGEDVRFTTPGPISEAVGNNADTLRTRCDGGGGCVLAQGVTGPVAIDRVTTGVGLGVMVTDQTDLDATSVWWSNDRSGDAPGRSLGDIRMGAAGTLHSATAGFYRQCLDPLAAWAEQRA
jgi:hypothetical protein